VNAQNNLPSGWDIKPVKHVFSVLNGATPSSGEASYWDGNIYWATPEDIGALNEKILRDTRKKITKAGYENCGTQLAPAGSIVMTTRAPVGNLAIAGIPLCTNQGCRTLVPKLNEISSDYFYYQFIARKDVLGIEATGTTFLELGSDDLKSFLVWYPPVVEQHAIADYLDRETGRLDTLIAVKERLLELLAEKRRSVITHAVTRGLNPNVSLRDSGVEWLGDIPSHWEVRKLKHIAQVSYGVSHELDRALISGVPIISLPNVAIDGTLSLEELGWADISEEDKPSFLLKRGDLLFNWRNGSSAHLGKTAYFDADGEFTHVGFLLRIRFENKNYESQYYHAFLNGLRVTGFFAHAKAMVNNTFNQSELENLSVMIPPIDEQREIVKYINEWTAKIDRLYSIAEQTLNLLHERRTSLIAAAVSGQIRVV
jgi:type I restriction enzyme S subunit